MSNSTPSAARSTGIPLLRCVALVACLLLPTQGLACLGDCNGDCQVDVAEILVGVGIALGTQPLDRCHPFDHDESNGVEVNEIVAGVNAALEGCSTSLSFRPAASYTSGDSPRSVVLGDVNSDGWIDIVAGNHISHDVSVLLNDGNGRFVSRGILPVGTIPLGIALGDFDRDTHLDIATANGGSGDVSVLLGHGRLAKRLAKTPMILNPASQNACQYTHKREGLPIHPQERDLPKTPMILNPASAPGLALAL